MFLDNGHGMSISLSNRRRIQRWLQKAPWAVYMMRQVLHWIQPRFTAGVVGVVLNARGEVLVVEHVFHPQHPWGLPGGWLEPGESPAQALKRELQEETGMEATIVSLLLMETGYYSRAHLDVAFLCRAQSDVRGLSSELLDYRWTSLDEAPPMMPFHQAAILAAQVRRQTEV